MKKILYILSNDPTGGVGTVVLNYQNNFSNKIKIDYLIFTSKRNTPFQEKVESLGSKIFYLPEFTLSNTCVLIDMTNDFFKKNSNNYSVAHLHYAGIATFVFYFAKKYGIKNRIIHSHNTRLSDNFFKNIRNRTLCCGMKKFSTHYFACSKMAGDYLFGKKFCRKKDIFIMNNAVNIDQFNYNRSARERIRNRYGINNEKVLIHVGRFEQQKNHGYLIEIIKSVVVNDSNIKVFLIGDGPLLEEIKHKVNNYNLSDFIIFTGIVENINDYLCASDIFILPSLYEGLPLVAVEAQASGLYCLLSDKITKECFAGGIIEFISLDNKDLWVRLINDYGKKRESGLLVSDYNIQYKAKEVETFYLRLES